MRRALNWILIVSFAGIISLPPLANALGADGADVDAENREAARFPAFSWNWDGVRTFLPQLDKWFMDHFAFRSDLVRWHGITRYFWLHVSPNPAVAVGRRGWLFY